MNNNSNNKWCIQGCKELAEYFSTLPMSKRNSLFGNSNNKYYYIDDKGNWNGKWLSDNPADMELITVADYLFKLPEKWCVRVDDNSEPSVVAKWRPTKGCGDYWETKGYINYDGYHSRVIRQGCTEITIKQFIKHVLNNNTQMSTQTLTRGQLLEMHTKDSCSDWRKEIESILSTALLASDSTPLTIPQKSIDMLIKRGSAAQKSLAISAGVVLEEDKSVEVPANSGLSLSGYGLVIDCRDSGEYKGKGWWLSGGFNWELKTDNKGGLCLIPTKK